MKIAIGQETAQIVEYLGKGQSNPKDKYIDHPTTLVVTETDCKGRDSQVKKKKGLKSVKAAYNFKIKHQCAKGDDYTWLSP